MHGRAARRSSPSAPPSSVAADAGHGVARESGAVGAERENQASSSSSSRVRPVTTTPETVYHFSEDGSIDRFAPHVPPTNPGHPPAVFAMDAEHEPLYWFPRHCPRISVWAYDDEQQATLRSTFDTDATRICAAESGWLDRIRTARIYRYAFDGGQFAPWADADGQYIATRTVHPERIEALDDLLALHADAEVELRLTPMLGTLMDTVVASGLPFGFVRIRDARR